MAWILWDSFQYYWLSWLSVYLCTQIPSISGLKAHFPLVSRTGWAQALMMSHKTHSALTLWERSEWEHHGQNDWEILERLWNIVDHFDCPKPRRNKACEGSRIVKGFYGLLRPKDLFELFFFLEAPSCLRVQSYLLEGLDLRNPSSLDDYLGNGLRSIHGPSKQRLLTAIWCYLY